MTDQLPVLVEVRRGKTVESRHRGAIIAVEPDGTAIARLGESELITSTRSTIKPIQAIPFITTGAAGRFNTSSRELAVVCASHEGEPIHTETVAALLTRAGLDESALRCGPQVPYNNETARQLEREGRKATQLHNNCSGKHAAMVMTALHRGLPLGDYYKLEHPVQQAILGTFKTLADLTADVPTSIDGCSAPTFGVPLRSIALAFSRLVNPDSIGGQGAPFSSAARQIVSAMIEHPDMVGGTRGRFDTELLRAAGGKLICKIGAEAVYGIGVLPSELYPRGLGIAIKIEDGSYRGLGPAVVETLSQLRVLAGLELAALESFHKPAVENRQGLIVGEVAAVFELVRM
jgi:L-asparaginase II